MTYEHNPFEDADIAKLWVTSVEGEKGMLRDGYFYPALKKWLAQPEIYSVLDIGAGQGVCMPMCIDAGKEYTGVEPSALLVDRAKELYGADANIVIGNAYALPQEDESVDGVFSINVWFHLENSILAAKEVSRVLKPGGSFFIITFNPEAYDIWKSYYRNIIEDGKMMRGEINIPLVTMKDSVVYRHTEEEMNTALTSAGLTISESIGIAPVDGNPVPLFRKYVGNKRNVLFC